MTVTASLGQVKLLTSAHILAMVRLSHEIRSAGCATRYSPEPSDRSA